MELLIGEKEKSDPQQSYAVSEALWPVPEWSSRSSRLTTGKSSARAVIVYEPLERLQHFQMPPFEKQYFNRLESVY